MAFKRKFKRKKFKKHKKKKIKVSSGRMPGRIGFRLS